MHCAGLFYNKYTFIQFGMDDIKHYAKYPDLLTIYQESFSNNFTLPALTDYGSRTMTYGALAKRIARLHLFYELAGVKPGDKVALMGRNSVNWIVIFMGTITYGAVIVPILNDFNPVDAQNIINHSDANVMFINESIWEKMNLDELPEINCVVGLESRKVITERAGRYTDRKRRAPSQIIKSLTRCFNKRYPEGFTPADIKYPPRPDDETAVINYTSGTTGFSKGVMLTYRNLWGNVVFGLRSRLHYEGSRALSFLPLAHAYACAFDMLVPMATGSHVTVLGRQPTPQLLLTALRKVKPSLVICVPLILEKIYKKVILPMISKPSIRWVLSVPMLDKAIYSRIRAKLVDAFGGNFEEVIVGGAPLNPEVEEFLLKIHFPLTVGYGMTECGPLISYSPWRRFTPGSAGRTLRGLMQARILKEEGAQLGEIMVKGVNVMKGYYKNPDATEAVLEEDGWLHTGDMGTLGEPDDRTIFIRGRYKTMILSATGQNIYPEEIEAKLNNMPYVNESIIVERGSGLTGLIYPDFEGAEADGITRERLTEIMEENRNDLNSLVAPYEKIGSVEIVGQPFEKTPKQSIKRFLYK